MQLTNGGQLRSGFSTTANVTSNADGDYAADDFVFGSPQLADDGDPAHDYRFFFDKAKAAFRAGYVENDEWDDANVGTASAAFGVNTTASAQGAVAGGVTASASGAGSAAFGVNTTASNTDAIALGRDNTASGLASHAFGYFSTASGDYASVLAGTVTAGGDYSVGIGLDNTAYVVTQSNVLAIAGGDVAIGDVQAFERLDVNGRLYLRQTTAPGTTTNRLYNVGGNLFWNGTQLDAAEADTLDDVTARGATTTNAVDVGALTADSLDSAGVVVAGGGVVSDTIAEDTADAGVTADGVLHHDGDVILPDTGSVYLGDPAAEGTWRITRAGNDLAFQRNESSTWVTKTAIDGD